MCMEVVFTSMLSATDLASTPFFFFQNYHWLIEIKCKKKSKELKHLTLTFMMNSTPPFKQNHGVYNKTIYLGAKCSKLVQDATPYLLLVTSLLNYVKELLNNLFINEFKRSI